MAGVYFSHWKSINIVDFCFFSFFRWRLFQIIFYVLGGASLFLGQTSWGEVKQEPQVSNAVQQKVAGKPRSLSVLKRVIIQPNGWGFTKQQARDDLNRVMKLYEGYRGFRRDKYVAVVYVGKNRWQADGRCSYLVPPVIHPKTRRNQALGSGRLVSGSWSSKIR